jgi:hypothetical protein
LEIRPNSFGFDRRYLPSKDILTDRMGHFGPVELGEPYGRPSIHAPQCLGLMRVNHIKRGNETAIRIGVQ